MLNRSVPGLTALFMTPLCNFTRRFTLLGRWIGRILADAPIYPLKATLTNDLEKLASRVCVAGLRSRGAEWRRLS
jgi:hypothetical protein